MAEVCGKTGLEIGGPSRVFRRFGLLPIYRIADRIDNCNYSKQTCWQNEGQVGKTFNFNRRRPAGTQYIAEGSCLNFAASESYDFLLASHSLEHMANPLKALKEWARVLREGGLLILVLPHRDGTFDHRRPVTPLSHLISDLKNETRESDLSHLPEILRLHDLTRDPRAGDFQSFRQRSERNLENRCLHHHVFDTHLAVDVVDCANFAILAVETARPHHIFVISRKIANGRRPMNEQFRSGAAACYKASPFPSDRATE
jgi:SAM-dependent methyltransferase